MQTMKVLLSMSSFLVGGIRCYLSVLKRLDDTVYVKALIRNALGE